MTLNKKFEEVYFVRNSDADVLDGAEVNVVLVQLFLVERAMAQGGAPAAEKQAAELVKLFSERMHRELCIIKTKNYLLCEDCSAPFEKYNGVETQCDRCLRANETDEELLL